MKTTRVLFGVLLIVMLISSGSVHATLDVIELENRILLIEGRLDLIHEHLNKRIDDIGSFFQATVKRIESIFYLISVLSVIIGFIGYKVVADYIERRVDAAVQTRVAERLDSLVDQGMKTKLNDWDAKFADKYKDILEMRRIVDGQL